MHFGHPKTTTAIKNQIFVKIWVFQGLPYTRLGPDLVILSPFWGKKFQNPCKKCPSHGENFLKIFLFFKNVPNSPRMYFGGPSIIRTLQNQFPTKISQKRLKTYHLVGARSAFRLIWPEMGPWDVLELFCTRNRYLNPSRSHFKKIRKIDFFEFFNCGVTPKMQS